MSSVCLSCAFKKDLLSVIISDAGKLVFKSTEKVRDESIVGSTFLGVINAFKAGFNSLKLYVEEHEEVDSVVIECNNSTFISWINRGYSKEEYHEAFTEMLGVLDSIPIRYSFSYNKSLKASLFLDKKYLRKEKLAGLLD